MSDAGLREVIESGGTRRSVTEPAHTPEAVVERFAALLADGDLEGLVELYEPDAAFLPPPAPAAPAAAPPRPARAPGGGGAGGGGAGGGGRLRAVRVRRGRRR